MFLPFFLLKSLGLLFFYFKGFPQGSDEPQLSITADVATTMLIRSSVCMVVQAVGKVLVNWLAFPQGDERQ